MKRILFLTLLLCATPGPLGQTLALSQPSQLSVQLPQNPKLNKTLSLTLPSGAPLGTVLSAIAKATGLTILTRDIPNLPVNLSFKGQSARSALEQLLSLYQDQIRARMFADTLIIAPPAVIASLESPSKPLRQVLDRTLSEAEAKTLSSLTGATITILPLGNGTVVSGSAAQLQDLKQLLTLTTTPQASKDDLRASEDVAGLDEKIVTPVLGGIDNLQFTFAYNRVYLQSSDPQSLKRAQTLLAQMRADQRQTPPKNPVAPSPDDNPQRRTIHTTLGSELLGRIVQGINPNIKLTPLDAGTYLLAGPKADLDAIADLTASTESREAMRFTITYPHAANLADQLRQALPNAGIRVTGDNLEVRASPPELVVASDLVKRAADFAASQPSDPIITTHLKLAFTDPETVAGMLTKLYTEPQNQAAAPASTSQADPSTVPSTAAATNQVTLTPTASTPNAPGAASVNPTSTVKIIPDIRNQGLILSGPQSKVEQMKQTATDLDARLADVRMALTVSQISGSDGQDMGLNWQLAGGGLSFGMNSGTLTAAFQPGLVSPAFQASLNLARSQGRLNTLLDTTFLAQDGRSLNFKNGGRILLPTTTTAQNGSSSTTSTGRETYNFGLDITITPRLSPDGHVQLELKLQLGQPPVAGVQNSIVITEQTMSTVATLGPGEQVILGSVLSTSDSSSSKGLPVLSQIPVIGALFGSQSTSKSQSLILITLQAANRTNSNGPKVPDLTRTTTPGK